MAQQTINIGTGETTGDGESIRSAFSKVNDNFDEVYSDIATLDGSKIVYGDLSVTTASASGSGSLTYDSSTGTFTFTPAASVAETNDLTSAVTWTNIPDAYVPQSAVTQHQAALTITQSQISDLSHFDGAYSSLTGAPTAVSAFTNDAGYITGYTVTEADVTAHEAALTITESQISDLSHTSTGNFTLSNNSITTSSGDDGIDLFINGATSDEPPAFIQRKWRFASDNTIQFLDPLLNTPLSNGTISTTKIGQWDTAYGWGDHASAGYLTSFTETNDLSASVTWANIPDAYVPESAVTQHQAALTITESQISDLSHNSVSAINDLSDVDTNTISPSVSGQPLIWDTVDSNWYPGTFLQVASVNISTAIQLEDGAYINFEGATDDAYETRLTVSDPSADRTITLPDATGTVALTSDITLSTLSITATASELNILDGVTATTTELNYVDGVTSAIQTQLDDKVSSDTTGITGADQVTNMVSLTQAEYDAIGTPNASTVYIIVG